MTSESKKPPTPTPEQGDVPPPVQKKTKWSFLPPPPTEEERAETRRKLQIAAKRSLDAHNKANREGRQRKIQERRLHKSQQTLSLVQDTAKLAKLASEDGTVIPEELQPIDPDLSVAEQLVSKTIDVPETSVQRKKPGPKPGSKQSVPTLAEQRAKELAKPTDDTATVTGAFKLFIEAYHAKPVDFVVNVLGAQPLPWQAEFLEKVASGERRISIRAGHGVGKSTVVSWALIWHMLTRYPQKSVCTAPTASQLYDALFAEVKHWVNKLPPVLRDLIDVLSDRIVLKSAPESSFLSARTSSKERPEAMAGIHSEHVMLVFDEASAVEEVVFESAAGSMSGHNAITILIGNPTRNSGLFFMTHHRLSSEWVTMHVSCKDNPLVSADFIKQIADTYGENSNAYRVRVLGEFALKEDDTLIPAELVDSAIARDIKTLPGEGLLYGVDVARFGDDRSVLVKRRGNVVEEVKAWTGADLMETVGRVVAEARIDKPEVIMVDSIGLGAGVADRLRELGFNVRDVNVAETASMDPTAAKLRDELWLACRNWLATRAVSLPKHDELRQELVAPTYTFLSNGKIKVEGKGDMKKRGMRSPDIADALCLTFAGEGALIAGRASRWVKGQPLRRNIKGLV